MTIRNEMTAGAGPDVRMMSLLAIIGFVLVYTLGAYSGWLQGDALLWWNDMAWTLSSLAAGLKCLHTGRGLSRQSERRAWYAFGVAALLWCGGMLVWDYMELVLGEITPFPSGADVFFVGFALAFIAGIFYYRDTRTARYVTYVQFGNLGIIICAVIIVISVILYPQIRDSDESLLFIGFAVSYPVVFMSAFVFTLFSYWFYVWTNDRKVFPLMLVALFIHAATDTLYSFELLGRSYGAGNYLNVFWILAFAVQYWAALEQDARQDGYGPEGDPVTQMDHMQNLEGIVPSISLFFILVVMWVFGRELEFEFLEFVLVMSMVMMAFMVIREGSMSRSLVHARKSLESAVEQRTLELSQAVQELEAYNYSIAHDLRSPLRSIAGFSQILLEESSKKLDAEERDYLQRIVDAGIFMDLLIKDILELARINRADIRPEWVDISGMSRGIAERLMENHQDREVKWNIHPNIRVKADPRLMLSVMDNLIGNAFKYSSSRSCAFIEVGTEQIKGHAACFVRDNGIGFDMQYYQKLFQPFQRLHVSNKFPGTGVGLATVARVIERHGGRIWADARPDEGAVFYFYL